jgi:hypothetical protein
MRSSLVKTRRPFDLGVIVESAACVCGASEPDGSFSSDDCAQRDATNDKISFVRVRSLSAPEIKKRKKNFDPAKFPSRATFTISSQFFSLFFLIFLDQNKF